MNTKIRVLQINAVYGVSSTGRNCMELDEASESYGVEMHTAYAVEGPYKPKRGYLIGGKLDRNIHALTNRITGLQGYASKGATNRLLDYIEGINPEVAHLNNMHSNYINMEKLLDYLADRNIGLILTLHDCWFYTGRCVHYTSDMCDRWRKHCGQCPRLHKDNPSWWFDRSERMLADKKRWYERFNKLTVVGVSDWITNEAKKSPILEGAVFERIYNWIDVDKFNPTTKQREVLAASWGASPDSFIILAVSTIWSEDKGLSRFNKLAEVLGDEFSIVLVGRVSPGYSLHRRIISVPATHSATELASMYASADVFLSLSKEETFGKVTAEALACGTPVVVSNMTANPELVETGTGYVIDVDNLDDIVCAINKIKIQGKLSYQSCCRESAVRRFNKQSGVAEYMGLYRLMLE